MRLQLPENGYESPGPRDGILSGNGIKDNGERRRNGFATGTDDARVEAATQILEEYTNGMVPADKELSVEKRAPIRAGIRDRVGCYTWTWFTMTMATGGIANVLHSSNDTQYEIQEVLL